MESVAIPIILLLIAIGALFLIARELDQPRKRKLTGIIFFLLCILFFISQISYLLFPTERYRNFGGLFGHFQEPPAVFQALEVQVNHLSARVL